MRLAVCSLWLAGLTLGAGPDEELIKLLKQFTEAYHAVEQNYAERVAPAVTPKATSQIRKLRAER